MLAFISFLAGIAIGYVLCIWYPAQKPEKEIVYIRPQEYTRGNHRIIPEHPPVP